MQKYSVFNLIKNAFKGHKDWEIAWKDPTPKKHPFKSYWQGARTWRELGYGSDAKQRAFNPTVIDGGRNN